jgi:hypothetical protein
MEYLCYQLYEITVSRAVIGMKVLAAEPVKVRLPK